MPITDTTPSAEAFLLEGYRSMTPSQRLQRVVGLNRALDLVTAATIRHTRNEKLTPSQIAELAAARYLEESLLRAVLAAKARRAKADGAQ